MLPEEQDQQRKKCTQLLDDIIESLTDNLFVAENSIHEKQIDVLLNQTKLHLKKIKEKFLTSSLNIESFNALFKELTECIEGVYNIMSQIFKYVSSNINKLTTKIQTLSTQMDNIKTTNTKLLTDIEAMQKKQKEFQKRIEQLEQQELKRIKKEKYRERQVLIRDLFSIPKDWLCEELIHNNLPDTDVKIYSKRETDSKKLLSEYPLLYSILQKVSKEFEIDPVHMLNYLKEKKDPNKSFHVNADLKKYVYEHTNYDLKQFLETKEMYPLDEQDYTCYRCTGHVIEWTKSFYSTTTRTRKMLDIPDAIKTEYDALQIFKYKKHDRVLARVIEKQVTITKALDVSRVIQEPTYYQNLPLSNYVVSSTGRLSSSLAIMQKEVERLDEIQKMSEKLQVQAVTIHIVSEEFLNEIKNDRPSIVMGKSRLNKTVPDKIKLKIKDRGAVDPDLVIPHDFSLAKPLLRDNVELIKFKTEMIDNLFEIEIAYSVLDESYNTIEAIREGEFDRFQKCQTLDNHQLLWHGSRTTNFADILDQDLRIAPSEATGYMFGKGVYFADMVSKKYYYINGDVLIPMGYGVPSNARHTSLLYNEYIVYNTDLINTEISLRVDFQ
ncbi:unnamed protein product [Rotaria sp. Silwood1]|nr:unnamed protein product [Rotaria sp. Silwood1]CAF1166086.1 unnamed protein product [Rotaria sp. Silwood1]